jgi:hypothetical protein
MGLDMYLHRNGEEQEFGYWRKANAIHAWMVDNLQNGVDECQDVDFPLEKIVILYNLCKKVLKDPEKNCHLLPTRGGFFFGSELVDDNYIWNVKHTKKLLKKCLKKPDEKYTYGSSW